jgi:hypothetical protein
MTSTSIYGERHLVETGSRESLGFPVRSEARLSGPHPGRPQGPVSSRAFPAGKNALAFALTSVMFMVCSFIPSVRLGTPRRAAGR